MTLLSGWLFADLLLGLAVIFLVTAPAGSFAPLPPTETATPMPTYTPNPTYTIIPTHTPNPTYTIMPTYTPIATYTPLPTHTPNPTFTVLPTYTPNATYTALPTYTAIPTYTPLPTYTPRPAPTAAESQDVVLAQEVLEFQIVTNPDALLSSNADTRTQEQDRLRDEIRQQLSQIRNQKAGIVLSFGTAPTPYEGGLLSQEVNELLKDAMPDTFDGAVMRDFHNIEGDSSLRGVVELEIYVIVQNK